MKKIIFLTPILILMLGLAFFKSNITGQTVTQENVIDVNIKTPFSLIVCDHKILLTPFGNEEMGLNEKQEIYVKKTVNLKKPPTLKDIFNIGGIYFDTFCIGPYCAGDSCPNNPRSDLILLVNGAENKEYEKHALTQNEIIQIRFE